MTSDVEDLYHFTLRQVLFGRAFKLRTFKHNRDDLKHSYLKYSVGGRMGSSVECIRLSTSSQSKSN